MRLVLSSMLPTCHSPTIDMSRFQQTPYHRSPRPFADLLACDDFGIMMNTTWQNTMAVCVQDEHDGGISDRPEDMVDAFHTFFGVAALSLMEYDGLEPIDPVYALPVKVMNKITQL